MPQQFRIVVEGDEKVIAEFEDAAIKALNLRPVFKIIIDDMMRIEETVFYSGGRRGGGSWAQLKPDTIRKKGHSKILFESGALQDSLTKDDAKYQIKTILNTSLTFGTTRPGAIKHQEGFPKQNIPARPFIRFLSSDLDRWEDWIKDYLLQSFRDTEGVTFLGEGV